MRYSIIPVHGIQIDKEFLHRQNSRLLWGLVEPLNYKFFQSFVTDSSRLIKELKMINTRLKPHCFLFVFNPKIETDIWDDERAELILSCLSLLTHKNFKSKLLHGIAPIFRKRCIELADLPISFNSVKMQSVGHSSKMDLHDWPLVNFSNAELQLLIDNSNGIFEEILNYQKTSIKKSLLLPYIRLFDSMNIGGLITSILTILENIILIEGETWKTLKKKLEFLLPNDLDEIDNLLKERNNYVHSGHIPVNETSAIFGLEKCAYLINRNEDFKQQFPQFDFKSFLDLRYRSTKFEIPLDIDFEI